MNIPGVGVDWKRLFKLLYDAAGETESDSMFTCVINEMNSYIPADREASVIRMKGLCPYICFSPQYAQNYIDLFNNGLNRNAPMVYDPVKKVIPPVKWKSFSRSEYDRKFNFPLDIGYSMGCGFSDWERADDYIICLHRTRRGRPFTPGDLKALKALTPLFSRIYNLSRENESLKREQIYPRETQACCMVLSKREAQISEMLCRRLSQKEIARRLCISRRTVEAHALHIYQKLDVTSRRDLIERITGVAP